MKKNLGPYKENPMDIANKVRNQNPLIHHITNAVSMQFTANVLLCLGASPVMAHAHEEVSEMTSISDALVINIGTLDPYSVKSMELGLQLANQKKIPSVLDPVGVGATTYRTETAKSLLATYHPSVVRGNASEIMALAGHQVATKGVDSTASSESAIDSGYALSQQYQCVVCISGAIDFIIWGDQIASTEGGHPIMTKVTGIGCAETAAIAAFAAVHQNPFEATIAAMQVMGQAGKQAALGCKGPGSFATAFLDALAPWMPKKEG